MNSLDVPEHNISNVGDLEAVLPEGRSSAL